MIDKITTNKDNLGEPRLHPINKIKEKLDYYRDCIPKLKNYSQKEINELKENITNFFTLKSVRLLEDKQLPKQLIRISNNNKVLESLDKPLNFLTEIDQILAPPKSKCRYNRCSLPTEQILYCATDLITAYWETKPKKGDVITISLFELKNKAKYNCGLIQKGNNKYEKPELRKVYHLIEQFFIEVFTRKVSRENPIEYLFSAVISSNQLFYPIASKINLEAIIYPSVQRELYGYNVAIKNDVVFNYYNLKGIKTAFVTKELENIDPELNIEITENILFEPITTNIDMENRLICHKKEIAEKFDFLRQMQLDIIKNPKSEERFKNPIDFNVIQELRVKNKIQIDKINPKGNTLITVKHLADGRIETTNFSNLRLKILGGVVEILK